MNTRDYLISSIYNLDDNPLNFDRLALEIFLYQYQNNSIYQAYVKFLNRDINTIDRVEKIPFMPIEFFKSQTIKTGTGKSQIVFESSGTTGSDTSKHFVSDLVLYENLSIRGFEKFYGSLTDYHIFALLPSYLERGNSSLVYMVQNFIFHTYSPFSGFYLDDYDKLVNNIKATAVKDNRKILLLGVSFALLDLVENQEISNQLKALNNRLIIMETGGMKGRRKEMVREDLHAILCHGFGVDVIHSEYGMTELLSQGYSKGDGDFKLSNTIKILLREVNDPFAFLPSFAINPINQTYNTKQKTGGINVIDLANIDSCSFIETKDLGTFTDDFKKIKIVGRFDNSDLRGCNLLVN